MNRNLLLTVVMASAFFATACVFVTVTPETATNPVGTSHTVTATLALDVCEFIPEAPFCGPEGVAPTAEGENVLFEVIEGPNAGQHSDGNCGPNGDELCYIAFPGESISWTYTSNGVPGIDYIQVCPLEIILPPTDQLLAQAAEETGMSVQELANILSVRAQQEGELPEINEPEPEEDCDIVSKVWLAPTPEPTPDPTSEPRERIERSVPNIGAGLSGLFNGQPTALPGAATAVAPAATSQTIRPPSTGDAGLR